MLLDGKVNKDSKNVLKTVIFSLQVGFTVLSNCVSASSNLAPLFSLTVSNYVMFFQVIG